MSALRGKVIYDQDVCGHEPVEVSIGQREMAAWERSRLYIPDRHMLMVRYAAWDALRRRRALPVGDGGKSLTYQAWDDLVEEVDIIDGGDSGEDPTSGDQPSTD